MNIRPVGIWMFLSGRAPNILPEGISFFCRKEFRLEGTRPPEAHGRPNWGETRPPRTRPSTPGNTPPAPKPALMPHTRATKPTQDASTKAPQKMFHPPTSLYPTPHRPAPPPPPAAKTRLRAYMITSTRPNPTSRQRRPDTRPTEATPPCGNAPWPQRGALAITGRTNPNPGPAPCFGASPFGRPFISARPHWLALASPMCEGPANGAPQNEGPTNGRSGGPSKNAATRFHTKAATQGANHPARGFQKFFAGGDFEFFPVGAVVKEISIFLLGGMSNVLPGGFRIFWWGGLVFVCRRGFRFFFVGWDFEPFAGWDFQFFVGGHRSFGRADFDFLIWGILNGRSAATRTPRPAGLRDVSNVWGGCLGKIEAVLQGRENTPEAAAPQESRDPAQ